MPAMTGRDQSGPGEPRTGNAEPIAGRRVLRTWRFWTAIGVLLALAAGYVWAIERHVAVQNRDERIAQLVQTRSTLRDTFSGMKAERDLLRANQSEVEAAARHREDAVAQHEKALEQREARLRIREQDVLRREKAVTEQERIQERNTITEGTWAVGVDVRPGTYRTKAPVSGDCYWSITSDANGSNIVANDIVTGGRPTVTLGHGQFFTTNRCGEWLKV